MTDLPDIFTREADGTIWFKGHRLRLIDVAARYEEGHSAEAILADFYPTLSLAQIYRAIAYHLENVKEVRALIAENDRIVDELRSQASPAPSLADLRKRLHAKLDAYVAAFSSPTPSNRAECVDEIWGDVALARHRKKQEPR
jgi:uncharacterized protein (DUF433 family)